MESKSDKEERLREAACKGDIEALTKLIAEDVDINSQNEINGWTPLHWACKRNHKSIVQYLLNRDVDTTVKNKQCETGGELTNNAEIKQLLGIDISQETRSAELPIVPNYLANPEFIYSNPSEPQSINGYHQTMANNSSFSSSKPPGCDNELVLKIRIAYSDEKDFFESDLDKRQLTFDALLNLMCAELNVDKKLVHKIRKLPDTIVRNDKDVKRLVDFQELEMVLTNKAMSAASRNYGLGLSQPKQEEILY